jgi:hypothetical protein
MSETIEVVAKASLMVPAGLMEPGDRFSTTRGHARELAARDQIEVTSGEGDVVDRAASAGDKARAVAEKAARTEAKAAEPAPKAAAKD